MVRKRREPALPRLVAVEGPLGVGKRALVERWAAATGARRMEVDASTNPFLPELHADPGRWAFPAQICFLLARHRRQLDLRQGDLFARAAVTDFVLDRDRIYAEALLGTAELALYERIFSVLKPHAVRPDLLVALRAKPERLFERLRARRRAHERGISPQLVERIATGYAAMVSEWKASPVVTIDLADVDLAEEETVADRLIGEVRKAASELGPGERAALNARKRS